MVRRERIKESGMQTDTALKGFGIQKKYSPGWGADCRVRGSYIACPSEHPQHAVSKPADGSL